MHTLSNYWKKFPTKNSTWRTGAIVSSSLLCCVLEGVNVKAADFIFGDADSITICCIFRNSSPVTSIFSHLHPRNYSALKWLDPKKCNIGKSQYSGEKEHIFIIVDFTFEVLVVKNHTSYLLTVAVVALQIFQ